MFRRIPSALEVCPWENFRTSRFLFDHGAPWDSLSNGDLLNAAEQAGFEVLLTTDRRIRFQQNLKTRRIALVVLTGSTKWSLVRQHVDTIAAAVTSSTAGSYAEVDIPFEAKRPRS